MAKRLHDLEQQLGEKITELQMIAARLENHSKSRARTEAALRKQLESATTAQKHAHERCTQLESDLGALRRTHEELNTKLTIEHQVATDSARRLQELEQQLAQKTTALERVETALESQVKERTQSEAGLRKKLDNAAAERKQSQARCTQLEKDLESLRQAHEGLNAKLINAQHTGADSAKRILVLEKQLSEKSAELCKASTTLESQSRELIEIDGLRQQLDAASAARKQTQELCAKLEQDLGRLSQTRQELNAKLAKEQRTARDSAKRILGLEQELAHKSDELQKAALTLENQVKDRVEVETGLRKQVESSTTAQKQAQERCGQLEDELTGLRQAHGELNVKLAHEQKCAADFAKRGQDLQSQLDLMFGAHGEAQAKSGQLQRELDTLRKAHAPIAVRLEEKERAVVELDRQLRELQALVDQGAHLKSELEARITHGVAQLSNLTAELSAERGLRERLDCRAAGLSQSLQQLHQEHSRLLEAEHNSQLKLTKLGHRLQELEETSARDATHLRHEQAERQLLEERLTLATELNSQLQSSVSSLEGTGCHLRSNQGELESRLQGSLKLLSDTEARLRSESAERQRLADSLGATEQKAASQSSRLQALETQLQQALAAITTWESRFQQITVERGDLALALETTRHDARHQAEQSSLEICSLRSALELEQAEKRRLELNNLQLRHASADAAQMGRSLRSDLRKQVRRPVEHLYDSARALLSLEMDGEQKKLAQSVLHDVLTLHTVLEEPESILAGQSSQGRE